MKLRKAYPLPSMEAPCSVTGKACFFVVEEWEDDDGEYRCETFCADCHRDRDWTLDEYEEF